MRITGSQSRVSTSALISSAPSRFRSAKARAWQSPQTVTILVRLTSKSQVEIVRIGTGSVTPGRRAPCATVPMVRLVETLCVSGWPAPFSSSGMWQVTHVGARLRVAARALLLRRVDDAVLALLPHVDLLVVRAHVAGAARGRLHGLLGREGVARVAAVALAHRAVGADVADVVAALAHLVALLLGHDLVARGGGHARPADRVLVDVVAASRPCTRTRRTGRGGSRPGRRCSPARCPGRRRWRRGRRRGTRRR